VEKIVVKRPLASEGIPPLIADRAESLAIFAEILERGAMFYPDYEDEAAEGYPRVCRIVALAES
jgi:hypothetical protein